MPGYLDLWNIILPVFGVMAVGAGMRRLGWVRPEADSSLLKLVVNVLYPALIFANVYDNPALRDPGNLGWAPVVGFATMAVGMGLCYQVGKWLGMEAGAGLRTFAFSTGIYNYTYITVPLLAALFGKETLGVLFAHNVGCEAAIWTVGIFLLTGGGLRSGWRRLMNPPVCALLVALVVNLTGTSHWIPDFALRLLSMLAVCAIPVGVLVSGITIGDEIFRRPAELFDRRVSLAAIGLRLGVLTALFLLLARHGPFSADLKHVILAQSAMPAAFFPLVLTKHYGGHPIVATQVVLATVLAALVLMPLWLWLGLIWIG